KERILYDTANEFYEIVSNHKIAEKFLVACVVLHPETIAKCIEIVGTEDFYDPKLSSIFETTISLYKNSINPDIISLSKKHKISELSWIWKMPVIEYEILKYASEVKNNSISRKFIEVGEFLKRETLKKTDITSVVNYLESKIENLSSQIAEKSSSPKMQTIMSDLEKEIELIKERNFIGFPTWNNLDQLVDGLIVPHIWIVGGYPGTGKTFFALQLIQRIMENGASIILFSTENSKMRNALRIIGCKTGIYEMKMLKGNLDEYETVLVKEAKEELKKRSLFIYDDVFNTSDIRMKVKKHCQENKTNVVVIDYIQQLNSQDDNYEQMRSVSLDLQRMAKECNVAMILVSQITNEGQKSKSFFRMNFKGAGEIGAIADVAIELKRSESEFNTLGAIVKKVRHGMPGKITFKMFTEENKINKNYIQDLI
ncbi:MAG: DnaB-like helicase C-terminal domain-containing protein, partial [Nanoarchaeota archaeon]